MKKRLLKSVSQPLVFFLLGSLVVYPVRANGALGEELEVIRLVATATTGPIGRLTAYHEAAINGRLVSGERAFWSGETLYARRGALHLTLENVGQVSLASGSLVKLSKTSSPDGTDCLIASVVAGAVKIRLERNALSYIEAGGSAYQSSRGANFQLAVRDGKAIVEIENGKVQAQADPAQRRYKIRPIGIGSNFSVRARATRQIQVQVTDENDRPVPDVPVLFALGQGAGGSLGSGTTVAASATVTTNAQGMATTSFTAGATQGQTSITASVPGTNATWTANVSISLATGLATTTTIALIAAAAGATVATVVIARRGDGEREPIQGQPPIIRPQ